MKYRGKHWLWTPKPPKPSKQTYLNYVAANSPKLDTDVSTFSYQIINYFALILDFPVFYHNLAFQGKNAYRERVMDKVIQMVSW